MPRKMSILVDKHIYTQTGFSYKVDVTIHKNRINQTFAKLEDAIKARDAFISCMSLLQPSLRPCKNHRA
jgi:hypothetical protein